MLQNNKIRYQVDFQQSLLYEFNFSTNFTHITNPTSFQWLSLKNKNYTDWKMDFIIGGAQQNQKGYFCYAQLIWTDEQFDDIIIPDPKVNEKECIKTDFKVTKLLKSKINDVLAVRTVDSPTILIYNTKAKTKAPIKLEKHQSIGRATDWNQNNNLLTGANDNLICLWDINQNKAISIFTSHKTSVLSVAWNSGLVNLFSSISEDGIFYSWDSRMNKPFKKYTDTKKKNHLINMSQNLFVASDDESKMILYDINSDYRKELKIHDSRITCLQKMAGKIISGHEDGSVFIWDQGEIEFKHKHQSQVININACEGNFSTITTNSNLVNLWCPILNLNFL